MSDYDDHDGMPDREELLRIIREMLENTDPADMAAMQQAAAAAGLPFDPAAMQNMFGFFTPGNTAQETDWSRAREVALQLVRQEKGGGSVTPAEQEAVQRAFSVATLWLDEATQIGPVADSPRAISRTEWVQQSIDTWVELAKPVSEAISKAMLEGMREQLSEEVSAMLGNAAPMLQNITGAIFTMQLGTVVGKLALEVLSAGDVGIPLFHGTGREGGALIAAGASKFAEGLEQDTDTVLLYLAVRELAHARLFRHAKWLGLHLQTAILGITRDTRINVEAVEDIAEQFDHEGAIHLQAALGDGSLFMPRTPEQQAAHARLETMLALVEGWVDAVTEQASHRIPGAEAIAEMVRRRRAAGGPAEHAFAALAGVELRPRKLREAAAMWKKVFTAGGISARDNLWTHPDLLPTAAEIENPELLLKRIGLTTAETSSSQDTAAAGADGSASNTAAAEPATTEEKTPAATADSTDVESEFDFDFDAELEKLLNGELDEPAEKRDEQPGDAPDDAAAGDESEPPHE